MPPHERYSPSASPPCPDGSEEHHRQQTTSMVTTQYVSGHHHHHLGLEEIEFEDIIVGGGAFDGPSVGDAYEDDRVASVIVTSYSTSNSNNHSSMTEEMKSHLFDYGVADDSFIMSTMPRSDFGSSSVWRGVGGDKSITGDGTSSNIETSTDDQDAKSHPQPPQPQAAGTAPTEIISSAPYPTTPAKDMPRPRRSPASASSKKSVSFADLHIREYDQVQGDHPCCTNGPAVSLGWNHVQLNSIPMDVYETNRAPRRTRRQLKMNSDVRRGILAALCVEAPPPPPISPYLEEPREASFSDATSGFLDDDLFLGLQEDDGPLTGSSIMTTTSDWLQMENFGCSDAPVVEIRNTPTIVDACSPDTSF